jgi:hypothetical protein
LADSLGITPCEASLLHVIHYGITLPESELCKWGAKDAYSVAGPCTEEECRVAIIDCLAKGWLQVIDESSLARIRDELADKGYLGPIYGWPLVGTIDFTRAGAELWRRVCDCCFPDSSRAPFAYTDVIHVKMSRYYRTQAVALEDLAGLRSETEVVAVSGPFPTGPWRAQWWRRFAEGYRIDIEERTRWQGHSTGLGASCHLQRNPQRANPQRLREVLNRHNVTLVQWIVLAAMEGGPLEPVGARLASRLKNLADREFKATISAAECRDALDTCLRYGWLQILDREAVDEIHAFLRGTVDLLAVHRSVDLRREFQLGDVDFLPAGAALYRTISDEWLGADWENDLTVSDTYYCEEHRYCESDAGFQSIVQEHVANGIFVRANRIVPIGPWCVYWWEQYSSGYRLELELGTI